MPSSACGTGSVGARLELALCGGSTHQLFQVVCDVFVQLELVKRVGPVLRGRREGAESKCMAKHAISPWGPPCVECSHPLKAPIITLSTHNMFAAYDKL